MNLEELKTEFNINILSENSFEISKFDVRNLFLYLKNNSLFNIDVLLTVCAVDFSEFFEISYILYSSSLNEKCRVVVKIEKENPQADTVSDIFQSANWDEREIYDLFGINFINHPDLKRLFMPENWLGHPLRKDYIQNDKRLEWGK